MIRLIFNGFYKSGSTMMWWILKQSNPDMLCFYEPLSPELFKLRGSYSNLHKLPVWEDYDTSDFKQIEYAFRHRQEELMVNYDWDVLPSRVDEVAPLLDLIHELDRDSIIQPNRCHFVLKDLSRRYNCKFIHIIRNPIDTWIAYTIEPVIQFKTISNRIKLIVKRLLYSLRGGLFGRYVLTNMMAKRPSIANSYYLSSDYDIIHTRYNIDTVEDYLDMFLIVWTMCNYEAFKQTIRNNAGIVVYYEDIVHAPKYWFRIMRDFSDVKFDTKLANYITSKYVTKSDRLRNIFVERLDRLGLLRKVRAFYPPSRWFGD